MEPVFLFRRFRAVSGRKSPRSGERSRFPQEADACSEFGGVAHGLSRADWPGQKIGGTMAKMRLGIQWNVRQKWDRPSC
jgi:hypothetical protein